MTEPNSQGPGANGRRIIPPEPQVLMFDDGGDYTVKPIPPEWEKIQAWRASQKEAGAASNGPREYGLPEPQRLMFDC